VDYHGENEIPERLLKDLANTPVIPEYEINDYIHTAGRESLTDREVEILRCASYGLNYDMIADILGISSQSVQAHLKNARYILRAKNTTHAVATSIRHGLIR
jgi:DNA-binding CsgD family transcriptional regulator